jgi:hypothetical protein
MKHSVRIAAAVAAASLSIGLVAGCGGSDSAASSSAADTTATTAALTKEEFVAAADAVCADVHAKADALTAAIDSTSLQSVQDTWAQAVADATAGNAELQAITPPADLATDYQAFLDAHAASQANGEALLVDIKAATTVDDATAAVEANTDIDTLDITGKEAAAAVGLTECAKD